MGISIRTIFTIRLKLRKFPKYFVCSRNSLKITYKMKKIHSSLLWDGTTLVGYIGEACFGLIVTIVYFVMHGSFFLLFISVCLYHQAFYRMFQQQVQILNCNNKNQDNKELLCKLIRFHVMTKTYVEYFRTKIKL